MAVEFPNTLTEIGSSAFIGTGLTGEITFPTSLVTIKEYAFYDCNINTITFPNGSASLSSIANHAFAGTSGSTVTTIN